MFIQALKVWLSGRKRKQPISTIVLHATAGPTATGAISTLRNKGFSYHYIIEDQRENDGLANKCVPLELVAFHAGVSFGPNGAYVNNYSIGVSLVNRNDGVDPYSKKQYESVLDLCKTFLTTYPTIKYLTTHYWISPGRKTDPRGFPMDKLIADLRKEFPGREIMLWNNNRPQLSGKGVE